MSTTRINASTTVAELAGRLEQSRPALFNPQRSSLYTSAELMEGYSARHPFDSLDARIGAYVRRAGGRFPNLVDGLAQTLHDNSIESALRRFVGDLTVDRSECEDQFATSVHGVRSTVWVAQLHGQHSVARHGYASRSALEQDGEVQPVVHDSVQAGDRC